MIQHANLDLFHHHPRSPSCRLIWPKQHRECPHPLLCFHHYVSWALAMLSSQKAQLHQQPDSGTLRGQGRRTLWESAHAQPSFCVCVCTSVCACTLPSPQEDMPSIGGWMHNTASSFTPSLSCELYSPRTPHHMHSPSPSFTHRHTHTSTNTLTGEAALSAYV